MNNKTTKKTYLQPASIKQPVQGATSDMILNQINQRKLDTNQAALNSAALQDHIMKSFNLKQIDPFRKLPPRQPVSVRQSQFTNNAKQILANVRTDARVNRQATVAASSSVSMRSYSQNGARGVLGPITEEEDARDMLSSAQSDRSYMNDMEEQKQYRSYMPANISKSKSMSRPQFPQKQSEGQSAITKIMEDQSQKDKSAYLNIEKKRMQYIKNLSLAQRLGLVEKPDLPLSQDEWKQIESQSLKRFNEKEPCPICYEDLRLQEQIILSCTHVFHKTCLESFEKFQRSKGNDKCCPICRKKDYDQKAYVEGMKKYLLNCILSMQALTRGFLARNHFYQRMKDQGYQPKNQNIRKRFIGYKLSRIGKKYLTMMTKEREEFLGSISKVDKSIKDTEKLLESFIPNMARIWNEKREKARQDREQQKKDEEKLDKFWKPIMDKFNIRAEKECPVCYNSYRLYGEGKVYLLDCSHMYHKCCLESFEKFDYGNTICCPMCRHPEYKKKLIQM